MSWLSRCKIWWNHCVWQIEEFFSCCQVVLTLNQGLLSFPCLASEQVLKKPGGSIARTIDLIFLNANIYLKIFHSHAMAKSLLILKKIQIPCNTKGFVFHLITAAKFHDLKFSLQCFRDNQWFCMVSHCLSFPHPHLSQGSFVTAQLKHLHQISWQHKGGTDTATYCLGNKNCS